MANNPTIIIGSLNDQELENSINKLCLHVQKATSMMTKNFDDSINHIEKRLKELGQINVNIGVAGSSGNAKATTRRKSEQQQIAEDTKAANVTLDQQATIIQKITSEVQQYSDKIKQAADLVRSSKQWENGGFVSTIGGFGLSPEKGIWSLADKGTEKTITVEQQLISLAERRKISEQEVLDMIQREVAAEQLQANVVNNEVVVAKKRQFQEHGNIRDAIAQVLGIEREEVRLSDERTASLSAMNKDLKQMQQAYSKLNSEERNSENGKALLTNMQLVEASINRIRREMNTPASLDLVQILPEKSLNDIAYKMKQYQAYQNEIDVTNEKGRREYAEVGYAIDDLKKRQDRLMGGQRNLMQSNNALTRSFNYMKNRLAFMFTVGGTTAFVKQLAEVRGEYEMTERALGVLVDSAQRGTQIFHELSQMALVSPYTLIELSNAAKQLTAYDIAARDVVDTTRRLADISAAVGAPVERLTYALGQIKAYEYLNSRDARIFANAGIPLVKQLSEYYSQLEGRMISVGDVYDRIKKKAVSYNDVMGVLTRMTDEGGRFFDYQAKVADTLKVQLANLTLAWNNMLNQIGEAESGLLSGSIQALKSVFLRWKDIDRILKSILQTFVYLKAAQAALAVGIVAFNSKSKEALRILAALRSSMDGFSRMLTKFATSPSTWMAAAIFAFTSVQNSIRQANETMAQFNDNIESGAKESTKAFDEMLNSAENTEVRMKAMNNALTPEEGLKAWEMLRGEIENSSSASDILVPQLLKIEDINERVTKAFDMAEKIKAANAQLSNLRVQFSTIENGWLPGLSGQYGLGDLMERYGAFLNAKEKAEKVHADEMSTVWQKAWANAGYNAGRSSVLGFLGPGNVNDTPKRIQKMISQFVKDASDAIRHDLGAEAAKDAVQVTEAVQRVLNAFFQQFPNIRKDIKDNFESITVGLFADEFDNVFDAGLVAEEKFFEELRRTAKRKFFDIDEDILDEANDYIRFDPWGETWFDVDQFNAIQAVLDKMTDEWRNRLFDKLGDDLNSQEWRMAILAYFGVEDRDPIQKAFDTLLRNDIKNKQTSGFVIRLRRGNDESDLEWEKRLADMEKDYGERIEQSNYMLEQEADKEGEVYKARAKNLELDQKQLYYIKLVQELFGLRSHDELDAAKHTKKNEDILADAIKREIQLVNDVQKRYEEYRKLGMTSTEALNTASEEYGNTLADINKKLKMFGLDTLSMNDLATKPLSEIRDFFQNQLRQALNVKDIKPESIEALEKAITSFIAEIAKSDFQKAMDNFNAAFDEIKDAYDMAKEMKDSPELAGIFADMLGLSDEDVRNLPSEIDGVMQRIQSQIKKDFGKDVNLGQLLNLTDLNKWFATEDIKADSGLADVITQAVKYINDIRRKEATDQIAEWNKLLEKYAEYEYKRTEIIKQAERERETARKNHASEDIFNAIDKKERQQLAGLDFEQFQKSNMWLTATGDLATLTDGALRGLIDTLDEYKDKAKDLDPKDIKSINSALRKMHKELRKGNPFTAIIETIQDAKDRTADFQDEINETEQAIAAMYVKLAMNGGGSAEDYENLARLEDKLSRLKSLFNDVSQISPTALVAGINDAIGVARTATNEFKELMSAIGGKNATDAVEEMERVMSVVESAGQGAAIGALIGGGLGAAIGAVAGGLKGLIVEYTDIWNGNRAITKEIEKSERAVRRFQMAYVDLEHAINSAYATEVYGAQRAAVANKALQLAELQRQLTLEESRKEKNKDEDRIIDMRRQIKDLQSEIAENAQDIAMNLLGISNVSSAAEQLVSSMIDAFRQGEDYMKEFEGSFEKMIDNMIIKAIAGRVIGQRIQEIIQTVEDTAVKRAEETPYYLKTPEGNAYTKDMGDMIQFIEKERALAQSKSEQIFWDDALTDAMNTYNELLRIQPSDVEAIRDKIAGFRDETKEEVQEWLDLFDIKFGEDSTKQLSALQQGIQGITEETAGAIEAYLNGVSQQVYLHSDLLMQIRDTVQSFDLTLQAGIQGQILLQLQSSYLIMRSMEALMNNWTTADGMGIRVEMKN